MFSARVHPRLRASPRPLRVLAARRRLQDRQARGARRGVRPAGPRADRSRRHERRRRALQGLQEARHQADPRPRGVLRRRPHGPRGQDRAQPPDADRRRRRGLPQPRQALQRRASSRACTAASRASTWSCCRATRGRDRAHRLPGLPRSAAGSSRAASTRPARTWTSWSRSSAPRTSTSRSSTTASPSRTQVNEAIVALRPRDGPAARRHRRRPLPAPRGLPPPRGAAVRADEVHAGRAEDVLRHQRVLS